MSLPGNETPLPYKMGDGTVSAPTLDQGSEAPLPYKGVVPDTGLQNDTVKTVATESYFPNASYGSQDQKAFIEAGKKACKPGDPSCGYFASGYLRKSGVNVPVLGAARDIVNHLKKNGGVEIPRDKAQAGDLVYYYGPGYGVLKDEKGNGYHVGVYDGKGTVNDSSGGQTRIGHKLGREARFVRPIRNGQPVQDLGYGQQNQGAEVALPYNSGTNQPLPKLDLFSSNPKSLSNLGKAGGADPGFGTQNEGKNYAGPLGMQQLMTDVLQSPEVQSASARAKVDAEKIRVEKLRNEKSLIETQIQRSGLGGSDALSPAAIAQKRKRLDQIYRALDPNYGGKTNDVGFGVQNEGPQSTNDRRQRLTLEYNQLGSEVNKGQSAITQLQAQLNSGAERINRLVDLINGGRTELVPEYNAMVTRIKGIGAQLDTIIDKHNQQANRLNIVSHALKEYQIPAQFAPMADKSGWEQFRDNFIARATDFLGVPNTSLPHAGERDPNNPGQFIGAPNGGYKPYSIEYALQGNGSIGQGLANLPGELARGAGEFAGQVGKGIKAGTRTVADAYSVAAGNGVIDPEVWKTDRGTQIAEATLQAVPYFTPFSAPIMGGGTIAGFLGTVEKSARKGDASETLQALNSMNPWAESVYDEDLKGKRPLRPEESIIRGIGLLAMAVGGAKATSNAVSKASTMKYMVDEMGMTKPEAKAFYESVVPVARKLDPSKLARFSQEVLDLFTGEGLTRERISKDMLANMDRTMIDLYNEVKAKNVDLNSWNEIKNSMESNSVEGRVARTGPEFKSELPKTEPPPATADPTLERFKSLEVEAPVAKPKAEPKIELPAEPVKVKAEPDPGTSLKLKNEEVAIKPEETQAVNELLQKRLSDPVEIDRQATVTHGQPETPDAARGKGYDDLAGSWLYKRTEKGIEALHPESGTAVVFPVGINSDDTFKKQLAKQYANSNPDPHVEPIEFKTSTGAISKPKVEPSESKPAAQKQKAALDLPSALKQTRPTFHEFQRNKKKTVGVGTFQGKPAWTDTTIIKVGEIPKGKTPHENFPKDLMDKVFPESTSPIIPVASNDKGEVLFDGPSDHPVIVTSGKLAHFKKQGVTFEVGPKRSILVKKNGEVYGMIQPIASVPSYLDKAFPGWKNLIGGDTNVEQPKENNEKTKPKQEVTEPVVEPKQADETQKVNTEPKKFEDLASMTPAEIEAMVNSQLNPEKVSNSEPKVIPLGESEEEKYREFFIRVAKDNGASDEFVAFLNNNDKYWRHEATAILTPRTVEEVLQSKMPYERMTDVINWINGNDITEPALVDRAITYFKRYKQPDGEGYDARFKDSGTLSEIAQEQRSIDRGNQKVTKLPKEDFQAVINNPMKHVEADRSETPPYDANSKETLTPRLRKSNRSPQVDDSQLKAISEALGVEGLDHAISDILSVIKIDDDTVRESASSDPVYESKVKPALESIYDQLSAKGLGLTEFFDKLKTAFGPSIAPYATKFLIEKSNELKNNVESPKETTNVDTRESDTVGSDQPIEEGTRRSDERSNVRSERGSKPTVRGNELPETPAVRDDERSGEGRLETPGEGTPSKPRRNAKNYRITDEEKIGETTRNEKARDLVAALTVLKELRGSNRLATNEEKAVLAKYPGTGWLGNILNEANEGENKSPDPRARDIIKALVPEQMWAGFKESALTSHYTSIPIVDFHWDIAKRLGYKGGPAIETSSGVGNFVGRGPAKAEFTMVEYEAISSEIADALYPEATVYNDGFQNIPVVPNKYLAISNIPFNIPISDYSLRKRVGFNPGEKAHYYFFVKALDHLVDGGLIIFTTSAGTLQSRSSNAVKTREYLSKHADLVGAVRLPNNAFSKNAGTDVTTDILVFRKRPKGQTSASEPFRNVVPVKFTEKDGTVTSGYVNEYFIKNPDMVLGEHSMMGEMYQTTDPQYTVRPKEGVTLEDQLAKALLKFPKDIFNTDQLKVPKGVSEQTDIEPPHNVREFRFFMHEGKAYRKENFLKPIKVDGQLTTFNVGIAVPVKKKNGSELTSAELAEVQAFIGVRDALRDLLTANVEAKTDADLKAPQKTLKDRYEFYVKKFGRINDSKLKATLAQDEDYSLVKSLENMQGKKLVSLAPVFDTRVINYAPVIDRVESATDALIASLNNVGGVDLAEMERVSGITQKQLIKDLEGQIFLDPISKAYITADEYGSGNVKRKLDEAMASDQKVFAPNVAYLKTRQPKPVTKEEVFIPLGSKVIDSRIFVEFMKDIYGVDVAVRLSSRPGKSSKWEVINRSLRWPDSLMLVVPRPRMMTDPKTGQSIVQRDENNKPIVDYTRHSVAEQLFEAAFNNTSVTLYYPKNADGSREIDKDGSAAANAKTQEIKDIWDYYWKEHESHSVEIVKDYNEKVNVYQFREYDGSHLTLPGMPAMVGGKPFVLRPWQKNMIWRAVVQDFSYANHGVGTGKTFEIIGAAKELKRLGKRQKIVIATLKANKESIAADFLKMYPDANILVSAENSFDKSTRKDFLGKVATGNYDAIIMHHDQFKKIPMSGAAQERALLEAMRELDSKIDASGKGTAKQQEQQRKSLKEKINTIQAKMKDWQDSGGLLFEDLGIDHVIVDEAHVFKNITIVSDESSLSQNGSDAARDMMAKLDYLRTNGGGATFFSGTPVTNSISEAYMMFRYMAPEVLKTTGSYFFDDWKNNYAKLTTKIERNVTGKFVQKSTLFSFNNLPELKTQLRNFTDIMLTKTAAEAGGLKLPKLVDENGTVTGLPISLTTEPNEYQNSYFVYAKKRAENIKYPVQKGGDNILNVSTDNRKSSLAIQLIDGELPFFKEDKIQKMLRVGYEIWSDPDVKAKKGTQIVFCDLGTPKKATPPPQELYKYGISNDERLAHERLIDDSGYEYDSIQNENGSWDVVPNYDKEFNLYSHLKEEWIKMGIPESEIAFIHDANNGSQKEELYRKMNEGEVRILLASTKKGGVGVNVQRRLRAMHNMEAPWTPADLEQRLGRIWRQGNMWDTIQVYNHITVNSYDGFMWNKVSKKGLMIDMLWSPSMTGRSVDDDVMTDGEIYEQQAMIASGRQDILEYQNIANDFSKLDVAFRSWEATTNSAKSKLNSTKSKISDLQVDVKRRQDDDATIKEMVGDKFSLTIGGKVITDPLEAGKMLLELGENQIKRIEDSGGVYDGLTRTAVNSILVGKLGSNSGSISLQVKFENDAKGIAIPKLLINGMIYRPHFEVVADPWMLKEFFFKKKVTEELTEEEIKAEKKAKTTIEFELDNSAIRKFGQSVFDNVRNHFEKIVRDKQQELKRTEDELSAYQKATERPFLRRKEYDDLKAKFDELDATVGNEMRSGDFGQFGTGVVAYDRNWGEITERKRAQRDYASALKDANKEASEAMDVLEEEGEDAFNSIFGFGKSPSTKPGPTPKSNTPKSSKLVRSFPNKLTDAIYMALSPQLLDVDAMRTGLYHREVSASNARVEAVTAHVFADTRKYFDRRPRSEAHEWIDDIENGRPIKNGDDNTVEYRVPWSHSPEKFTLQDAADAFRTLQDGMYQEIMSLSPDMQLHYLENYFPHIWDTSTKELQDAFNKWMEKVLPPKLTKGKSGSRKFEGSKSFMKKRSIPTIKEGLENGLKLVSDNPVDLMLLKFREMNKFIYAYRMRDFLKLEGISQFVPIGTRIPVGLTKINSPFFDVFSPGEIEVHFAYDKKLFEAMSDIALDLGKSVEMKKSVAKGSKIVFGQETAGSIKLRYGANIETFAHELGHALDRAFDLAEYMFAGIRSRANQPIAERDVVELELRELAKLRYESIDPDQVSPRMVEYANTDEELMANFMHALIMAPELLRKFAPNALAKYKDFAKNNRMLQEVANLPRGLETGKATATYKVFGRTYVGTYYAPESVATIINNKLAPGLRASDLKLVSKTYEFIRSTNSILNSGQLGISGFHGLVTAKSVVDSELSAALGYLEAGNFKKALSGFAKGTTMIAPLVAGWRRGNVIKDAYLSGNADPELKKIVDNLVMAGGRAAPDEVYLTAFRRQLRRATWDLLRRDDLSPKGSQIPISVVKIAYSSIFATLESLSYWLMERMIPAIKLYAFEIESAAELEKLAKSNPGFTEEDKRATLAGVWDAIDNRFGEMVYDNVFFHNLVRDLGMVSCRAFGWNIGGIRQYGGAMQDTLAQGARKATGGGSALPGDAGPDRPSGLTVRQRGAFVSIVTHFIIGSIITYISTGAVKNLMDGFAPRNGKKNRDGTDQRIMLPSEIKDIYGYAIEPVHTLKSKVGAGYSLFSELMSNKDFYGTQITPENSSAWERGVNQMKYLFYTASPISMKSKNPFDQSGINVMGLQINLLNYFVGHNAPLAFSRTTAVNLAYEKVAKKLPDTSKAPEQFKATQAKYKIQELIQNIAFAASQGQKEKQAEYAKQLEKIKTEYPKAFEDAKGAIFDKDSARLRTPIEMATHNLGLADVLDVYKVASEEERKYLRYEIAQKLIRIREKRSNFDPVDYQSAIKILNEK